MNTAELLINCLEAEGVSYIFGVPGEETEDLLFAINDSEQIEFIPCRHEQGAAFIANVWGRISGQPGVCLSTLGPGATNLITGIADANLDKAPVVAITGQGSLERLHHESHQNLDVVQLFQPVTKWNTTITDTSITPEVVRKAFKVSTLEKMGATHIELPENMAAQEVPVALAPLSIVEVPLPKPNAEAILKAVQLINKANFPLILAGNGVLRSQASEALTKLVQYTNFPVATTFMGKGAISDDLPQSLMAMGLGFKDYIDEAVAKADVILTVGYDIAEYSPEAWNPNQDKCIIHIDFSPAEVYTHYTPQAEVLGDINAILRELYDQLSSGNKYRNGDSWYAEYRDRIREDIQTYALAPSDDTFHAPGVIHIIRKHLDKDGVLISDVGSHKMWIARNYETCCPTGCIISNGMASMGIAVPGGIAAQLLDQDRQVVAVVGDGGFLMNAQELATAQQLGLGFTIIVLNDNDYGLISWKQEQSQDRSAGTRLENPDFVQLAQSFGITATRPKTGEELDKAIQTAIQSNQMNLIEVPVDSSINEALTDKLKSYFSESEKV
jgi:acetolactate synthase-1/2/3 large subunit